MVLLHLLFPAVYLPAPAFTWESTIRRTSSRVRQSGWSPAWLANLPGIREPLTGWALRWMDSNPSQFYCFAFIVTYQVAELFDPALKLLRFIIFHRIG
jgi:hypothetical protein